MVLGTAIALVGTASTTYILTKPTQMVAGVVEIPLPNDAGVLTGQFYGLIGNATMWDGGTPDFPDAAPPPKPDAGQVDSGPPPAPDASQPDASQPDAGPTPPGPDGGTVGGVFEPSFRGPGVPGARLTQSAAALPAVGAWYTDVEHQTRVQRLPGYHMYSQLQAFSTDESMLLLQVGNSFQVVDRVSLKTVAAVTGSTPRWRRSTNKVVYLTEDPAQVVEFDPRTGRTTPLMSLDARYVYREASWEDTSEDGKILVAYVHDGNGARARFVVADLEQRRVTATKELSALGCTGSINWISPGVTGKSIIVQWNGDGYARCRGVEKWSAALEYQQHVIAQHPHSDHCAMDGREYLGSYAQSAPWGMNGNPAMAAFFLDRPIPTLNQYGVPNWTADGTTVAAAGGPANTVALRVTGWNAYNHFSCKGPSGWLLIAAGYSPVGQQSEPYRGEIWLLRSSAGGTVATVNRLAWHRSNGSDYAAQPKATLSPSGRFALFASDWFGTIPATSFLVEVMKP